MKEKRYEAAYAGFVYEAPATHWTPSTVVRQRLTKMDFTKPDGIELGGNAHYLRWTNSIC